MLETIHSKCRGVDDRTLRKALDKEIKLAIPLRRGPRIAPDVALALRLRDENKPWKEIYAAVVDPKLERPIRQAVCTQLRHKVKRHLSRRRLCKLRKMGISTRKVKALAREMGWSYEHAVAFIQKHDPGRRTAKGGIPVARQGEIPAEGVRG